MEADTRTVPAPYVAVTNLFGSDLGVCLDFRQFLKRINKRDGDADRLIQMVTSALANQRDFAVEMGVRGSNGYIRLVSPTLGHENDSGGRRPGK